MHPAKQKFEIDNWILQNVFFRWTHIYIITRSKVHIRDAGWTIKSGTPDDDIAENDDRMIRIYPLAMAEGSAAYRADCQTHPLCQGEERRGWQGTVRWESAISVSATCRCQGGRTNHYIFADRAVRRILQACNNQTGQRDFTERTKVFCIAGLHVLHKGYRLSQKREDPPRKSDRPSS